jgi:hypothetical protein
MATPNPSVLDEPVYIPNAKGYFSPGTYVELADGTVAMILKTAGLGNSEPEAGLGFRPRRVKVALCCKCDKHYDGRST